MTFYGGRKGDLQRWIDTEKARLPVSKQQRSSECMARFISALVRIEQTELIHRKIPGFLEK